MRVVSAYTVVKAHLYCDILRGQNTSLWVRGGHMFMGERVNELPHLLYLSDPEKVSFL